MKKLRMVAALMLLIATAAIGGSQDIREYVLFGGSDTDSTEQASTWVPIRGASRVLIRLWSTHTAFHASTDADSTFADSITIFKLLLSDSICCFVTGPDGRLISSAADSLVIPITLAPDSATKMVGAAPLPINKTLRAPANGSGLYTIVYPVQPGLATADANGVIGSSFMRIRVTPLRRLTVTGGQSTAGKRVNGLRGLRAKAMVYFDNR